MRSISAAFENNRRRESYLKEDSLEAYALAGEANLGDPLAYGFNYTGAFDIGYFDPVDRRIRRFEGGTGTREQATKADKPAITIKLAAALPDPFPYPPPVKGGFGKIHHYKPSRPALKGVKTQPFEEAMAYFKQVVA
jgi:hypothetical protein